ncbi:TetR/AcrR family transcriptional regulator [Sulfuriflexus mobilis]|uniref:TetR/AcrR family transcriptional regulator n=1 Tax=Sulfuriflexus mobilis TaxID=1811807 RepID=UPI000F84CF81|nr:TetR/AcrR family transcriptional regulator [Sulfuriflexus mobilis]
MLKPRQADLTRHQLLQSAMHEIHQHGFQGASLSRILDNTGLTKGALYHHFPNKLALGYAVVDELLAMYMQSVWLEPLASGDDPLHAIEQAITTTWTEHGRELLRLGCPINNLSQEMSPLDEGFRIRIDSLYAAWQQALEQGLRRGRQAGHLRSNLDIPQTAIFIMAAIEGCFGLAKNRQSESAMQVCSAGLYAYLQSLRAE